MATYNYRPRPSFERDLSRLGRLDPTIIDDIAEAIDILRSGDNLPEEYRDHELKRKYDGYNEFHVRDTPEGQQPTDTNDVVVIYKKDYQDLVVIGVRAGSHKIVFGGAYRKNK